MTEKEMNAPVPDAPERPREEVVPRPRVRWGRRLLLGLLAVVLGLGALVSTTERGREMVLAAVLDRARGALLGELRVASMRGAGFWRGATFIGVELDAEGGRRVLDADSVQVRFSLLDLLRGAPPVRSTIVWGLDVEISRYSLDEPSNLARIVPARGAGAPEPAPLLLGRLAVHEGRLAVLSPARAGSSAPTVVGPGGQALRSLTLEGLELELDDVVLRPDPAVLLEGQLASMAARIGLRADPLVVTSATGRVRYGDEGLQVSEAQVELPGSALRGVLALGPRSSDDRWIFRSEVRSDGWGRLEDLQWIDDRIPDGAFRGGAEILVDEAVSIRLDGLEVELEASSLVLDGDASFEPELFLDDFVATASPVALERLEPWIDREFPLDGWLSGQVAMSGGFDALAASGRVTLVPTGFGAQPSTGDFSGVFHMDADPGATGVATSFSTFNYGLLRAVWAESPLEGSGSFSGSLTGRASTGFAFTADSRLGSDSTRVQARGQVLRDTAEAWVSDVRLDLTAFPLGLTEPFLPQAGLRGSVGGRIDVMGPLASSSIRGMLTAGTGSVDVDSEVDLTQPTRAYRFDVNASGLQLDAYSVHVPQRSEWSGSLSVRGEGSHPDSVRAAAVVRAVGSRFGAVRIDDLLADLEVGEGMLVAEAVEAVVGGVQMVGSGRLGIARDRGGEARFDFESESLVGFRPLLMGLADSVMVRDGLGELEKEFLRLEGIEPDTLPTLREVRMDGRVVGSATLGGRVDDFALDLDLALQGGTFRESEVDTARVHVRATGLPRSTGRWTVSADVAGIAWEGRTFAAGSLDLQMDERAGVAQARVSRGPGEHFEASGDFRLDSVGGELLLRDARIGVEGWEWAVTRPALARWDEESFEVDSLHVERADSDSTTVVIDGLVTREGESDFHVTVDGLYLERALGVAQLERLDAAGRVDLDLTVHGPAAAPEIVGTFELVEPRIRAVRLSRVAGEVDYASQTLNFGLTGWDGARTTLRAGGSVPIDLALHTLEDRSVEAELNVDIVADSLDAAIALSIVPILEDVLGVVSAEVHLGGTTADPAPSGTVTLHDGAWSLDAIGVRHTDVNGSLGFNADRSVDVALSTTGTGTSNVIGTIVLEPFSNPTLDLRFDFGRFRAVGRPDIEGWITGAFDVTGRYDRPLAQGTLTVDQGTIYVDELQRVAGVVDLSDPFLFEGGIAVDTTALVARPALAGLRNPFFDNLRVNVDLIVPSDTWLRSSKTNVEMSGELIVGFDRPAGDFVLVGELQALRGSHLVLNRTFELDGGTVNFIGRPGLNPDLNIEASSRIRRPQERPLEISAVVEGTLVQPIVTLSTEEVGLAESDLISFMLFGQASDAIGTNDGQLLGDLGRSSGLSAIEGALTFYSGALANELGPILGRVFGLDYVSIQHRGGQTFDQSYLRDTQVEIGRYVGEEVFVVAVFRPPQAESAEGQKPLAGVRVEWSLTDDYNLEAFLEDRFLRSGSSTLGATALLEDRQIVGVLFFRDWGY